MVASAPPRRLIYLSLEYCHADVFSGHGVVARAEVRGLARQGADVLVICGRPSSAVVPDPPLPRVKVLSVPLPVWPTMHRSSAHAQYAASAAALLRTHLSTSRCDAVLAVDWTSAAVVRELLATGAHLDAPLIYLSFRVYCSMAALSRDDRRFYRDAEAAAVALALQSGGGVVALCDMDDDTLHALDNRPLADARPDAHRFTVIPPMLRDEFARVASDNEHRILDFGGTDRMYLVSLVRLSEDKGPHRFVRLLQTLQRNDPDIWTRTGVVPLICGSDSQPEYARKLKDELKKTVPHAVIMDKFLKPEELADILKSSIVNIHPAECEAYGLTIVEAAAMGCPTVLNNSCIGATQLLDPKKMACAAVDVTDDAAFANTVRRLLEDAPRRHQLAHSAYLHATSWTETEHARALLDFTNERIAATSPRRVHIAHRDHQI